ASAAKVQVADDQRRPALGEDLGATGDGAVLAVRPHNASVAHPPSLVKFRFLTIQPAVRGGPMWPSREEDPMATPFPGTHSSSRRISMRGRAVVATVLVASIYAQAFARHASVDWAVNATIIDGCSCRMLCPCIFGSPSTVGSAATHQHAGHRSCYFNQAFRVNRGHYGKVRLDGLKFWFAGDKGDAKAVGLTLEPFATSEQRAAIRVLMSHFLPLKWTSFTEGSDAGIDWRAEAVRAEAKLDGGRAAEVVLTRNPGATGEGTTVIKNMRYFAAAGNDGFNIMPVQFITYRPGTKHAP